MAPLTVETLSDMKKTSLAWDIEELLELDQDAIRILERGIEHVETPEWVETLKEFKVDHERHAQELADIMRRLGVEPGRRPHLTGALKRFLAAMRGATGDKGVLRAVERFALRSRRKYRRFASELESPRDIARVVQAHADDEARHVEWIESVVGRA